MVHFIVSVWANSIICRSGVTIITVTRINNSLVHLTDGSQCWSGWWQSDLPSWDLVETSSRDPVQPRPCRLASWRSYSRETVELTNIIIRMNVFMLVCNPARVALTVKLFSLLPGLSEEQYASTGACVEAKKSLLDNRLNKKDSVRPDTARAVT